MRKPDPTLVKLTKLMSDTMGKETGELYFKFYELEDDDERVQGARSLLHDFIGPDMTEKKLSEALKS